MTERGLLRLSSAVALLGGIATSGCLVSFDGYQKADSGGTGAQGATGGAGNGGNGALGGSSGVGNGGVGGSAADGGTAGVGNTGGGGAGNTGGGGAGNTGGGGAGNTGGGGTGNTGGGGTGNTGGGGTGNTGGGGTGNTGGGGTGNTGGGGTGNTGGGGTGNTGGGGTGGATGCPTNLKGPPMSRMTLGGTDFFCVDTKEVSNAQYEEFVSFGSLSGQPSGCSFNTSYAPQTSGTCTVFGYDPGGKPDYPVSCVDWCDAYMFCQWAGKRLCGDIGGGATGAADRTDASADQWYNACTLNGSRSFPYGNGYSSGRCNDVSSPSSGPFICGGFTTCSGNYPGESPVYDMSGNVQEWEDSCSGNSCASRGGDWLSNSTSAACAAVVSANRDVRDHHRGFRCCWDPPN
ncbi:MAG: formylglycine-generating enzyme family protein [Polyangiaceae bacterium]